MASQDREDPVQEMISQYLPTETLSEARNLAHRFQEGEAFRLYVLRRRWLVIPAGLVILLVGLACAAATVLFLGRRRLMACAAGVSPGAFHPGRQLVRPAVCLFLLA